MEILHNSSYFTVSYEKQAAFFHYIFDKSTSKMTTDEYISELTTFINLVKQHKPKKVLGDMVEFNFVISPEVQEWVNENLFKVYAEIGFQKIAILLSKEYIESLSIQQTMEEDTTGSFQTAFFDNEKDAMIWLAVNKDVLAEKVY